MTNREMAICGGCGVIAASEAEQCDACKEPLPPLGERRTVPPRADGGYWLEVRAQFKCKHCERRSPIHHVDVDGTFTCLRCQRDQDVGAGVWATGLRFCHEVGDLAGPNPEGRHPDPAIAIADSNKWADIGIARTRANLSYTETIMGSGGIKLKSLFVHARPGVPLCRTCREPLEVEVDEPGKLTARCAACGSEDRYETDPKATRMVKPFRGALSDDHRADRAAVKIAATAPEAPVAIECPGCGAALSLEARDHFVTCEFCHTPSKIPSRLRSQLFEEAVELEPFWLLFEGPSPARNKLLKKARSAKKRQAQREASREKERQAAASNGGPDQAPSASPRAEAERLARQRSKKAFVLIMVILVVAILVLVITRP